MFSDSSTCTDPERDAALLIQLPAHFFGDPSAEIAANALSGTWINDGPTLSADGKSARIAAGGRTRVVSLQDGSLSVTR